MYILSFKIIRRVKTRSSVELKLFFKNPSAPKFIYVSVNSFSIYLLSVYYVLGTVNVTKRITVGKVIFLLSRNVYSRERKYRNNLLMRH